VAVGIGDHEYQGDVTPTELLGEQFGGPRRLGGGIGETARGQLRGDRDAEDAHGDHEQGGRGDHLPGARNSLAGNPSEHSATFPGRTRRPQPAPV